MDDEGSPCPRLMLEVALALDAGEVDPARRGRQEARAAQLGLTGAEIDAARAGRSFDARAAAAILLALASRSGDAAAIEAATVRAGHAGLGPAAQRAIRDAVGRRAIRTACTAPAEPATRIRIARR